jgi:hypothetical protein
MYVVVSLEYLEKFILPIDEKSGRYSISDLPNEVSVQTNPRGSSEFSSGRGLIENSS